MNLLMNTLIIFGFCQFAIADNSFKKVMDDIIIDYVVIQESLASDSMKNVNKIASRIHLKSKQLNLNQAPEKIKSHLKNTPTQIVQNSLKLSKEVSITKAREAFKGLSRAIANWVEMAEPKEFEVYYCDMAKSSWVQKSGDVKNPFYGSKMLTCGEKVKHFKEGHDHAH